LFVAGTAVFEREDYSTALQELHSLAAQGAQQHVIHAK
jgi:hypothetical protein